MNCTVYTISLNIRKKTRWEGSGLEVNASWSFRKGKGWKREPGKRERRYFYHFFDQTFVFLPFMTVSSLPLGTAARQRSPAIRTSSCRLELVPVIVSGWDSHSLKWSWPWLSWWESLGSSVHTTLLRNLPDTVICTCWSSRLNESGHSSSRLSNGNNLSSCGSWMRAAYALIIIAKWIW